VTQIAAAGADTGQLAAQDLRYAWRALSVVSLASILTSLNQSTLTIALPDVVRHFNASSTVASWIVIVFGLSSTCVTLACGRMADVVGRRTMYLIGLGTFTSASLLLGFSPNVQTLIGLQIIQAVAEAMLLANSAVIVSSAFPTHMLGRALGVYMAGFSVAALLGPSVGGALASSFGWRWVFWFNVPLGVACLAWGAVTLRKMPAERTSTALDIRGNVLLALGLGGFIAALSGISTAGFGSAVVRVGLGLAVVFLPLFVWAESRASDPLLDIRVFANRRFTLAIVAGLINATATSAVVILVALYLQAAKGESALHAGLQVLPLAGAKVVASTSVGILTKRMPPHRAASIGSLLTTIGLVVLLGATGTLSSYGPLAAGMVVVGLGSGLFQPANAAASLEGVPPSQLGRINAIRLTVQNSAWVGGTALGLTLLTAPLSPRLQHAVFTGTVHTLGSGAVHDLVGGYRLAFAVMAVLSFAAVLTSGIPRPALARADVDTAAL
jgi:EmrB/QacA subfamily drug resistance transporter